MTHWSSYQEGVFEAVSAREQNLAVNAVAGSGKTTTIVEAAKRLRGSVYLAAFNKKMGQELQARVTGMPGKSAGTFHSIGYKALAGRFGPLTVKAGKISDEWYARAQDHSKLTALAPSVAKLASLAKQAAFGVASPPSTEDWRGLIEHFGVLEDAPEDTTEAELVRHVSTMLKWSEQVAERGLVDFDDMIYLPLKLGLRVMKFNTVFVDEAQDTNTARRLLTRAMCWPESRVVAVGDPRQCHPAGTMIEMTGGEPLPIEDVREGMEVVTYHECFRGMQTQGRKVLKAVKFEEVEQELLQVGAGNYPLVEMTPNHRVPTRMSPRRGYVVYLMESGGTSRLGCCQAMYTGGSGPAARLRHEQADRVWILRWFETKEEALVYETVTALNYGLPENVFFEKGAIRQRLVAAIGNNRAQAVRCLQAHGRRWEYPLKARGDGKHLGRYLYVTEACNLVEGLNEIRTYEGTKNGGQWTLCTITRRWAVEAVYGLEVEPTEGGHRLYVANGIVVHNSIYGFSGADSSAMQNMIEDFDMQELPLSICYRCSQAVIKEAQKYHPSIEAFEGAPEGAVREAALRELLKHRPQATDALLCRFNRPLVRVAFELIRAGVPTRIEGREIGESLLALTKKWPGVRTLSELSEKLVAWQDKEVGRLKARKQWGRAGAVADKVGAMAALMDRTRELHGEVPELQGLIKEMFQDSEGQTRRVFTLSSVHKAKGLEWDRVFVLGKGEVMPSPYATKAWELEQEQNLVYVAATRARRELVWLRGVEEEVEREGQGVKDEKILAGEGRML